MSRFIILVIDSFGVGAMKDVPKNRPQDSGANTCLHIVRHYPEIRIPQLQQMGLFNALGKELKNHTPNPSANWGTSRLLHQGGDTFWGHQEILGSLPRAPKVEPFSNKIDEIEHALIEAKHKVERVSKEGLSCLLVDQGAFVGDNLEAELGQVYNVSASLEILTFEQIKTIGKTVRSHANVARVISFGGRDTYLKNLVYALEVRGSSIGLNTPKSKIYGPGYQVSHMGYGINYKTQAPYLLAKQDITTTLIGKVADIAENPIGQSYKEIVDSEIILNQTLKTLDEQTEGLIFINIQETDLAGHAEDTLKYKEVLELTDSYIEKIRKQLHNDDIFLITADHGNDPTIGHGQHTRENVPILIHYGDRASIEIGERQTLSDIGATVCDFFTVTPPENGESFLTDLVKLPL